MAIRNVNGHGVSSLSGHHNQQVLRVNMATTTPGQIGVNRPQPRPMPVQGSAQGQVQGGQLQVQRPSVNPQSGFRQPIQGGSGYPRIQGGQPPSSGGHIL